MRLSRQAERKVCGQLLAPAGESTSSRSAPLPDDWYCTICSCCVQPLDAEDDGADHAHLVKDVADELALAGVDHLRLVVARQAAQHAAARVLQRANLAKKGREVELLQQETGGGAAQGDEDGEAEGQDPPFAATASAVPHPAVEALVRGEPSSMRNRYAR